MAACASSVGRSSGFLALFRGATRTFGRLLILKKAGDIHTMSSLAKRNADVEASDTSNMAYQLTRIMSSHGSEAGGTIVLNASWLSIEVPAGRRYDIPLKDLHGLAYHEPLCSDTSLTIETRRAVIHHVAEEPQELKNLTLQVLFANETLSSQLRTLVQGTDWAGSRPHAVFDAFERGVPTWATPLIRRGMYRPWMRTAFFIGWLIFVVSTLLLALIDFHAVFTELVPTFGFSFQEAKEAGGDSDGSGKKLQRILGPLAPIAVMGQNVCLIATVFTSIAFDSVD